MIGLTATNMRRMIGALALVGGTLAPPAWGQGTSADIASRVNAVTTGKVRMAYSARDGVCGDGWSWYRTRGTSVSGSFSNYSGRDDVEPTCQRGPVRVVVVREAGITKEIRSYVGGRWRADASATDLGDVPSAAAAGYLIGLAEQGTERVAGSALSAATLADSVDAAVALLRIARDDSRPSGVRGSALSWLGDVAGDKVAATLDSVAYEPGDREVRKQAIYAVSRRPADEAVPSLLRMAETLPDRELRKTAVFWLARTKDPRALAWITKAVEGR